MERNDASLACRRKGIGMITEWKCDVCSKVRSDERINVMVADGSEVNNLPPGTLKRNIKYCNDDSVCIVGANMLAKEFETKALKC